MGVEEYVTYCALPMTTKLTIVNFFPTASKYNWAIGMLNPVCWAEGIDCTEKRRESMYMRPMNQLPAMDTTAKQEHMNK